MVSTSTKFAPNKQTLTKKSVPLATIKHSIKNLFSLAGKPASADRNEKNGRKLLSASFQELCSPAGKGSE